MDTTKWIVLQRPYGRWLYVIQYIVFHIRNVMNERAIDLQDNLSKLNHILGAIEHSSIRLCLLQIKIGSFLKGSSCRLKGSFFSFPPVGQLNFCSILPAPFLSVCATSTGLEFQCLLTPTRTRDNTSNLSVQLILVVWTI